MQILLFAINGLSVAGYSGQKYRKHHQHQNEFELY
jgi:hypothetical protein